MDAPRARNPQAVLFACGQNSVRSPMAESLLRQMFPQALYVKSAGVKKGELDPFAVAVMAELGQDISGLLVARDGTASIAVRRTDPPNRRRFTIAHEIGHYVLRHHRQRPELVHADPHSQVIYRNPRASEGLDPIEVQANQFAASLLMPARLVKEQVERMGLPLSEKDVSRLAKTVFQVSEQAMTIRLTALGLI